MAMAPKAEVKKEVGEKEDSMVEVNMAEER